jgi:hypothetical protein
MKDNAVLDVHNNVMRCKACGEVVPIPMGVVSWVCAVMKAFAEAHAGEVHHAGRTLFSIPRGADGRAKPAVDCGAETALKAKITEWFCTGEVGSSSKAMAACIGGAEAGTSHPLDPDDLRRCVLFLQAVPEARQHMPKVRGLSVKWAKLVDNWDELEKTLLAEMAGGNDAPKTWELMEKVLGK